MKNILVMGGSYFVGRVFVEEMLKESEYALYVLNRGNRPLKQSGVTELVCDRHNPAALCEVLPACKWHAIVDFCAYQPQDITGLLQSIQGPVQQYIYISTATVYENSLALPMREETSKLTQPLPVPGGEYGYAKRLTELQLAKSCEEKGIAHLSLRPVFIYGKYNYAPRESYFFDLIVKEQPIILPSPPQALFSMVSVWDVVRVCIRCVDNPQTFNRAFTVSTEELISYDRLIAALEEITHKKFGVDRKPVRIIETRGIPLPFPLEEHLVYSGALLGETLNYRYMSFEEGMTKTWEWYSKKGI